MREYLCFGASDTKLLPYNQIWSFKIRPLWINTPLEQLYASYVITESPIQSLQCKRIVVKQTQSESIDAGFDHEYGGKVQPALRVSTIAVSLI